MFPNSINNFTFKLPIPEKVTNKDLSSNYCCWPEEKSSLGLINIQNSNNSEKNMEEASLSLTKDCKNEIVLKVWPSFLAFHVLQYLLNWLMFREEIPMLKGGRVLKNSRLWTLLTQKMFRTLQNIIIILKLEGIEEL